MDFFTFAISTSVTGIQNILDEEVDFSFLPEKDKKFGFILKDFNIKNREKIAKIMVFISTTKNYLLKWTWVF